MPMIDLLVAELENDARATRRLLERVPEDRWDWKPHDKSMTLQRLAGHVAEIPGWGDQVLHHAGLDFDDTADAQPFLPTRRDELLAQHDESLAAFRRAAEGVDDARLQEDWTLSKGGQVLMTLPRGLVVRNWVLNHLIHHRGQLTVYLRLLGVPLPPVYGNTADENPFE